MGLKAVIIDDEFHARENLKLLIDEFCPRLQVVGQGSDVASGLETIDKEDPDVVFLDIRMPSGAEGFELLRSIGSPKFMVVFVTAFKDYAIDAFKVNAVDYILKPIDIDELVRTTQRLQERWASFQSHRTKAKAYTDKLERLSEEMVKRSERITITHQKGVKLVRIDEIVLLKAENNCTRLSFKDGSQFLDTRTLKHYDKELSGRSFFRVHRSYLINLDELEELSRTEGNQAVLSNGFRVPVARGALQGLLARMKEM